MDRRHRGKFISADGFSSVPLRRRRGGRGVSFLGRRANRHSHDLFRDDAIRARVELVTLELSLIILPSNNSAKKAQL